MNIEQLFMWHRQEQERWANLAENNKANAAPVYKESLKRTYTKKAEFHAAAVALLKPLLQNNS